MARNRRKHSEAFKAEAVRRVREEGMTFTQVGASLDICKTLVRSWVNQATAREPSKGEATPAKGGATQPSMEEELARLRRENRVLREDREILKKAAAFFAKEIR